MSGTLETRYVLSAWGMREEGVDEKGVFALVRDYLVEEFEVPAEKIEPDAHLFTDLELDSIDAFDMVAMLENRLDVEIDDDALKKIRQIKDVVAFVLAHLPASSKAP
jgi:acyl carrier protein